MDSVPPDVVRLIVRRLPPRQQLLLRRVCRAWAQLLPRIPCPPLNSEGLALYKWPFRRKWRVLAFSSSDYNHYFYLSARLCR